jgi:hypothetical protein
VKRSKVLIFSLALLVAVALAVPYLAAQSTTQGAVTGTVTDPTGAVIPGAQITLTNNGTGVTQTAVTNSTGGYHFALLPPGTYTLSVASKGYQTAKRTLYVSVGQSTMNNVQMAVAATGTTVEVTAQGGVIQTVNPSVSTTMSNEQIALVPNGGGDLSYIAQTAPGSAMNTQGGYGNFSSFGLPANTNNFTVNSMPENDPFLNLNNSGATNILLGQNSVQEATVVTNGYSGQYSMAGANVNYVTKSGTNAWHGNANWKWNGRYVNANNYFNKQSTPETPRPFVNDNMWQASIGGPIQKDKTFFFVDTEGLYLIVPVTRTINIPTPAFATAVQNNIAAVNPSESPLYAQMFKTWFGAPGAANATPSTASDGGCGSFAGTAGFGPGNPCTAVLHSAVSGNTHEWLITARVDHNFGQNDRGFINFKIDRGVQATYTDPLDPLFNVDSYQPQYEGQLQETHTFSSNTVNSLSINGSYYRAIFVNSNLAGALAQQPVQVAFQGGSTSSGLLYGMGDAYQFPFPTPQGRNVTQYGFVDDLSHTMGNHTFKIGANLARYDITDYDPGVGTLPAVFGENFTDFFNGVATNFTQAYPVRSTQPVAMYNLGFYGEDSWKVRSNLNLTLTVRADRNSNPVCRTNCFSRLTGNFLTIDHSLSTPYNASILAGQSLALPGSYHPWTVEPRFGFNWSPDSNNVISGGFGLFTAPFPGVIVDSLMNNLPNDPSFTVSGLPFGPTTPGNAQSATAAAANALRTGFTAGQNWAALNAAVLGATGGLTGFSTPNFFNPANDIHTPRAQEWDLQFQHSFGTKTALTLKYVGNHAIWEQINNAGLNGYCGTTAQLPVTAPAGTVGCLESLGFTSFAGLPASPIDPRFLTITEASTGFNSNYNGLTATFQRRFSAFQFQVNYTWSHALDEVSNAGVVSTPFTFDTNGSIVQPQNPFSPTQNMYGNADYDVRHYLSINYVYTTPKNLLHGFIGGVLAGWTIGGTIFARSGLPFTVIDSATGSTLNAYGYGTTNPNYLGTFANQTGGFGTGLNCGSQYANPVNGPCPGIVNNFVGDVNGFGNQRRNQVYGPHFFDTDLTISKEFHIPGWEKGVLSFGATAYNLFNHPNFDQPLGDVGTPSLNGTIITTVNPPTSIYGSFLGADSSPRLLQSSIKLTF